MAGRAVLAALAVLALVPSAAVAGDLPARCALKPVNGDCKAQIEDFYFDTASGKCRSYFYDGCGPVVPFTDLAACQAQCEPASGLRIESTRRVKGLPFVRVELQYPADWGDNTAFTTRINGRETASHEVGGGSMPGLKSTTLEVFLGGKPASKLDISAFTSGGTHTVSAPLAWKPVPIVLLLDHAGDDEALLDPARLMFFVFKDDHPVFRLNGAETPAKFYAGRPGGPALWRVKPDWKPGRNVISAEAVAADGTRAVRTYSFVDMAGGRLAVGERARVRYGHVGTRSGPFYSVRMIGDAAKLGQSSTVDVPTIDAEGWFGRTEALMREVTGAAPGEATLRIIEKPHFLQPERVIREIRLVIEPAGPRSEQGGTRP